MFYDPLTDRRHWWLPIRWYYWQVWFWPIRWIRKYNRKDCKFYVPDVFNFDGSIGTKIKPFLGLVVIIPIDGPAKWNWWAYLKSYKKLKNNNQT